MSLSSVGVAFWVSFLAAALAANPVYKLLLLTKSRQTIYEHAPETHQVKQGTPTMGGIIILFGFLVACSVLLFQEGISSPSRVVLGSAVLAIGFGIIGFADDFVVPRLLKGKRGLGWKQKILAEVLFAVLAAALLVGWGFDLRFLGTVFLILFFSNAYNFSDGLDGLAGTLLIGIVFGMIAISFHSFAGGNDLQAVCAALLGGVLPFLFLNAPPAKVFMGDVGALPIGAILGLGASALLFGDLSSAVPRWELLLPILILSVMMIVELVPVPMQVGYYKLTKKRLFPFTPIHHAFEKKGWPESRVVWTFALVQGILSVLAISVYLANDAGTELKGAKSGLSSPGARVGSTRATLLRLSPESASEYSHKVEDAS